METDWQHYLTQCIETLASIAEIRPTEVFNQVVSRNSFVIFSLLIIDFFKFQFAEWQKPFEIFGSLEKSIDANGTLVLDDNARCQLVHCAFLRDLSSLCQTLTRLIPALQGLHSDDSLANYINIYFVFFVLFIAIFRLLSRCSRECYTNHPLSHLHYQIHHSK